MKTNKTIKKPALFIHNTTGKIFSRKKSVLFISLHKCATNFFSKYVLNHLTGRTNINFQRLHYEDTGSRRDMKVKTRKYGYSYGVIRILDKNHPSYEITGRLLRKKNLGENKVIFFVRDPRDILVSMYYSFGFTHRWSPHRDIRAYQEERREKIQKMTIDDYAIQTAPELKEKFDTIRLLKKLSADSLLLRYEDMIDNFEDFYRRLQDFVQLNGSVKEELFRQTRPRETERPEEHKRKGQPGGHKEKLKKDTIHRLNKILENTLKELGYETF